MRKQKIVLTALICSALIGAGSVTVLADGVTSQSDADSLNTSLAAGSQEYTQFDTRRVGERPFYSYRTGQVMSHNGSITIGTAASADHELTLSADLLGTLRSQTSAGNILSDASDRETTVTNLASLNLHLSGVRNANSIRSNLLAQSGGVITVDSSVKKLDAVYTHSADNEGQDANIEAYVGKIKVLSPTVNLSTEGGHGSISVYANDSVSGGEARVELGDETHELESITINHTTRPEDSTPSSSGADDHFGIAASGNSETSIHVNTKKLDIKNSTVGIRGQSYSSDAASRSLIQINSADHRAQSIHIKGSSFGISSLINGDVRVYGDNIAIQTGTPDAAGRTVAGVHAESGGHAAIGAGSDAGQGLSLTGAGSDQNTYGILAYDGYTQGSQVNVTSGNIDITNHTYGVMASHIYDTGRGSGTVNLGTADSQVNDIAVHNASVGLSAGRNGSVSVHGRNLTVNDNVRTPIYAVDAGTVDIHTSGTALIQGTGQSAINNNDGTIAVNTEDSDGSTNVTGLIYTTGNDAATNISFHTADSHFYGSAFDGGEIYHGKTTVTVSNGGDWTLDPTASRPGMTGVNALIDTLNLSDNGTVNLGGRDRTARNYSHMQTSNIAGSNGTLIFRTNLQESADNHTVNGHSDQLAITGSSAGTHNIMVNDYSQTLGQEARDGYVLLVRDRSTNSGAVFRGRADLQNGGLFAHPVEITNEGPDASAGYTDVPTTGTNWYLRMARSEPVAPTTPTWNAENNIAFARSRYGALWIEQDTLRQRVGELRNHTQDDGVWARIDRGEYSMNGVNGNADYIRYHIGYDKQIGSQKGQKQYIGMAYHHTDTDLNYRHFTDDSDMDADIGTIYYTNLQDKGHYLDIVGKFGRMKGKMKTFGEFPESAKWDSPFYSLSAEYGRKVMYKNDWYVEPQAQLTYSHLGSDSYLTSQGTHAHVDGINSLIFRTGFTVGKKDGQNEYYGKVFWHHEFEGAEDARFHDKNDDSLRDSYDFGGSWVTVGFGGQVGIGKDAYLYGDVDKSFGGDVKKKWAWNIGVRFGF